MENEKDKNEQLKTDVKPNVDSVDAAQTKTDVKTEPTPKVKPISEISQNDDRIEWLSTLKKEMKDHNINSEYIDVYSKLRGTTKIERIKEILQPKTEAIKNQNTSELLNDKGMNEIKTQKNLFKKEAGDINKNFFNKIE